MKRSDVIECKGLFFFAGGPMGISGRIEIKEHGPVQLGGQILFFSRTGPEALKDYCFTHGWGYGAWPTSCHGDVDTLGGHFLLFVFWLRYLGGLTFNSKVIKTDCVLQFRKQGLKLFRNLQCRISVCLEQQWKWPHKHCQQTSDAIVLLPKPLNYSFAMFPLCLCGNSLNSAKVQGKKKRTYSMQ